STEILYFFPHNMSTTTTIIDGKNGSVPSSSMRVGKKSVTEDFVNTFSSPAAWLLVVALIVTWSAVAIVMFDLVDYKDLAGRSVHKLSTEPLRIIHETLEESSDWIYGFFSLLSDIVWSDDDDSDEGILTSKDKLERQEKPEKKERHAGNYLIMTLTAFSLLSAEEKKVKSTKVEAKVKKEVKDGKGEAKTTEKVKQAETKTTETGLIKAKTKVKEEKALQTVTKSDKKGKQNEEETDEDPKKVVGKKEREWS
uniref:Triadin n=1 Tax=Junco hyemalis TaxID=40217 RepID=A0A8C5JNC4_JUNHY